MKKLLLILLCLPMIGYGQEKIEINQPSFEIGAVLGLISSSIYGDLKDMHENSSRTIDYMQRTNGGLTLQYNISKLFSINSKFLYQVKGYRFYGDTEITSVEMPNGGVGTLHFDISFYNHYISLPILMKLNFGNKLKGIINAGLYTSYLLKEFQISDIDYNNTTYRVYVGNGYEMTVEQRENTRASSLDAMNRIDFGLILGGGVSYTVNEKINLLLDFYREAGVVNRYKDAIDHYNISYNLLFGVSCILTNR